MSHTRVNFGRNSNASTHWTGQGSFFSHIIVHSYIWVVIVQLDHAFIAQHSMTTGKKEVVCSSPSLADNALSPHLSNTGLNAPHPFNNNLYPFTLQLSTRPPSF